MFFQPTNQRRLLLQGLAVSPLLTSAQFSKAEPANGALFAPFQRHDGSRGLARIERDLNIAASCTLPARAHDVVPSPSGQYLVVMERRPGRRAWVIDKSRCEITAQFDAKPSRHFEGHATFTPDGLLLTTENDYDNQRGVIGIRDPATWQVLDEFSSHGIGPHELLLMPDGKTLVVANGGILTHPSQRGRKLNLDTMRSALTYIELASGKMLDEWLAPDPHLSIRHLDVSRAGKLIAGMQFEGPPGKAIPPLLVSHQGQNELQVPAVETNTWSMMGGYVGSVRLAPDQQTACATSPRGGLFAHWDLTNNKLAQVYPLADVCGLDFQADNKLLLSSGTGQLKRLTLSQPDPVDSTEVARLHWDNHMRYVA